MAPIQLNIPSPGNCPERPLALSEFLDLFYKHDTLGNCSEITYPLIDITNSTKQLLIPALCDKSSLDDIVKDQDGDVWCDITLKSFGRSPWWQTIELSTTMASAIAELNCRHNTFCRKVANIMREDTWSDNGVKYNKDTIRTSLPDFSDIDGTFQPDESSTANINHHRNKIPNLCDLESYLDAWCGVLRIARSLGYYPKPPKNLVPLTNVSWDSDISNKCCEPLNLFKNEVWDLVPELCENIKNIKKLETDHNGFRAQHSFLHYNNGVSLNPNGEDPTRGFTNKINSCEPDGNESLAYDRQGTSNWAVSADMHRNEHNFEDNGERHANPTGYKHVSGFLKLIQMGLFDWSGCLAGRDDYDDISPSPDDIDREVREDMADWNEWFVDLKAEGDCAYDYDSSHVIPPNSGNDGNTTQGNLKVAFLLKLSTLKFCSANSFKNMLSMENFIIEETNKCYDYTDTLKRYFSTSSEDPTILINNCNYYNPCKRMVIKKNILKSNKSLKNSLLRLCGCSLTKEELLTTISDFIIRDMNEDSGVNNIISAKMNINYCKKNNGMESMVMYDANIKIDIGVYASLASICKDKESVDRVLKYVFNNPSNDVLSSVADSLLVNLQTMYPSCYPSGYNKTQVSNYGMEVYKNVLAGSGSDPYDLSNKKRGPDLSSRLLTHNKFMDCFNQSPKYVIKDPCGNSAPQNCKTCN